jgi:large subunit ribosomal protein L19
MNTERLKNFYDYNGSKILEIKPGMQIEIHEKDAETSRIRRFKCLVIKVKKPNHADGTFTVRGHVAGVEVEKIYPLSFNKFDKIILLDEYKVRRAKLYYIRDKVGKDARFKSKITADKRDIDLLNKEGGKVRENKGKKKGKK